MVILNRIWIGKLLNCGDQIHCYDRSLFFDGMAPGYGHVTLIPIPNFSVDAILFRRKRELLTLVSSAIKQGDKNWDSLQRAALEIIDANRNSISAAARQFFHETAQFRHKNYLKKMRVGGRAEFEPATQYRETHCWGNMGHSQLDSLHNFQCSRCGGLVCSCGRCLCGTRWDPFN